MCDCTMKIFVFQQNKTKPFQFSSKDETPYNLSTNRICSILIDQWIYVSPKLLSLLTKLILLTAGHFTQAHLLIETRKLTLTKQAFMCFFFSISFSLAAWNELQSTNKSMHWPSVYSTQIHISSIYCVQDCLSAYSCSIHTYTLVWHQWRLKRIFCSRKN